MATSPLFANSTQVREARQRAVALGRLTPPREPAGAEVLARYRYLKRVIEEHCYLDMAGIVPLTGAGGVLLDEVFVPLDAAENRSVDERLSTALDRSLRELEGDLRAGRISPLELEVEVEQLYERFAHGLPARAQPERAVSLGGIIGRESQVTVLGAPGAGKTTLLRWLAQRHAAERLLGGPEIAAPGDGPAPIWTMPAQFPIYVRLSSIAEIDDWRQRGLDDLLARSHEARGHQSRTVLVELINQELGRGSCLLLLDGLDEVGSVDDRRLIVGLVRQFADRWGPAGNRFVITSRSADYWSAPISRFAHYETTPVDPGQRVRLLERYCVALEAVAQPGARSQQQGLAARQRMVAVTAALDKNRGIAPLATNPFLLTMLIAAGRIEPEIPGQRAVVYESVVRALESGWSVGAEAGAGDLPDRNLLRRFLIRLAGWIHEHRPAGVIGVDDVMEAVNDLWAATRLQPIEALKADGSSRVRTDVERIIVHVCRHHRLLVVRGDRRWSFAHQVIQDFYVAEGLLAEPAPAHAMRSRLHDPRYDEPIMLALGIATHLDRRPDATALFDDAILAAGPEGGAGSGAFEPSEFEELIGRDRDFAIRAAADDVAISSGTLAWLGTGTIPHHLLDGLAGTSLGQRHVEHSLVLAGSPGVGDHDRWTCATSLSQLGERGAAAELFRSLVGRRDVEGDLRRRSAVALGRLGDTSAATLDLLRTVIAASDVENDLRWRAAIALGRLGDTSRETLELLRFLAAATGVEGDVRWSCAAALGQLGDTGPAAALLRILASDPDIDSYVRWSAVASLGQLGSSGAATLRLLRVLVGDPGTDSDVRWSSAVALGQVGDTSAETLGLLRALAADPSTDSDVRWSSAVAVGQLGDPDNAAVLLRNLAADAGADSDVRSSSAEALAALGDTAAAASLFRSLAADTSTSGFVRWSSAQALGRLGETATAASLLRGLAADRDIDPDVRRRAAASLGQLGDAATETVNLLRALSADPYAGGYVRSSSAVALGQLGDSLSASWYLRELVSDPGAGGHVRRRAAEALGQLGVADDATTNTLRALATSTGIESDLRKDCAEALSRLGALKPPFQTS